MAGAEIFIVDQYQLPQYHSDTSFYDEDIPGEPYKQVAPTEKITELPFRYCSFDSQFEILTLHETGDMPEQDIDLSVLRPSLSDKTPLRERIIAREDLRPYIFRLEFGDDQGNIIDYFFIDFGCKLITQDSDNQFVHPLPFMSAKREIIDGEPWLTNFVDINLEQDYKDIMFNGQPDMGQRYFVLWETELGLEIDGPQTNIGYFVVHFIDRRTNQVSIVLIPDPENPEFITINASDIQPDPILEEVFKEYDEFQRKHASYPFGLTRLALG